MAFLAVLAVLSACAVIVTWFPLLRIRSVVSFDYNEGWNAYRQLMASEGRPLYAAPPGLWITNYPFLSFHIVGIFGRAIGNMVLAGRIVAFASMIAMAALAGGIAGVASGSARGGIYAGLCLFLWIATLTPERRATDDPEMLGAAVAAFGLFAYVKAGEALPWIGVSALAFAAGFFIKQDFIAFPLSVGVHLLAGRRWKLLTVWVATGAAAACVLTDLTFRLDGPYFFANLLQPRAYVLRNLGENVSEYLAHFGAPLALGVALLVRDRRVRYRSLLLILLLFTNAISFFFAGGDGVASNIVYPPLIALAVACAVAICATARLSPRGSRAYAGFAAILAVPALAGAAFVPSQLHKDLIAQRNLPVAARAAHRAVAVLRSAHGPAICEDLLLCYEAGKPLGYDPYFVNDQILIHRLKTPDVVAMLDAHRYAAIEIDGAVNTATGRLRFTKAFMQTLLAQYRLVTDNRIYSIFEPRAGKTNGPTPRRAL